MRSDAARNDAAILEAARELISAEGSGVSMDAIAARAGVAVGTLYRHHPTKAALVDAVVRASIDQIAEDAVAAHERVQAGADVETEVLGLFRLVARRHATDQAVKEAALTLGLSPLIDPPTEALAPGSAEARAATATDALLRAAQQAGVVRTDVDVFDIWALVAGTPGAESPEQVRERYLDIVIAGLRPPGRAVD
jgi:AcrR family transcriptional regulator